MLTKNITDKEGLIEINNKYYKKQKNGKWSEVSKSHGLTKKGHKELANNFYLSTNDRNLSKTGKEEYTAKSKEHYNIAATLSDKQYTDNELLDIKESKVFESFKDKYINK